MEVQKTNKEKLKTEGVSLELTDGSAESNQTLQVQIPYDPLFEDSENIVFASSYSSVSVSDETLKEQTSDDIEEAVIISGTVNVSARKSSSSHPESGL